MAFILRTLCVVIGAAFLFAVANLAVSGLPERTAPVQLASDTPPQGPGLERGTLRDVAASLLGMASSQMPLAAVPAPSAPGTTLEAERPAPAHARALEADWHAWMTRHNLSDGALVVLYPDGSQHRAALGHETSTPVPVASLSKAITGICMDIVLREHGLGWYTSLGDIAPQMSAARVTPQPWNEDITLASLVNHTSGLSPDLTQGTMGSTLHGALGLHRRIASEALREENMQGTPRTYFYNNTNYAVLGVAIEALTGQSYAEACMERVVAPAGITDAVIQGRMGSRSAYGGWELSAEAHARLMQHWFSDGAGFVERPFDRPMHNNYSLGYRILGRGVNAHVTHSGHFCHGNAGGMGAYFHARGDGTVISINWTGPCVRASESGLDALVADAM